MKILGDYVYQNKLHQKPVYVKLREACIEFEKKYNVRVWTVIQEDDLETPLKLMEQKDSLKELLCDK